nr:HLA class II histocompatibility antigen, DR beta 3 chain [Lonchura striata domestica]
MGLGAAAGAVLVALVALGAAPAAGAELSGVFQFMFISECHFTNGTEKVRLVDRYIYNRLQFVMFDSDVGEHVGFTPLGEKWARDWNSDPELMEERRGGVDTYCRHNYQVDAPFSVERRVRQILFQMWRGTKGSDQEILSDRSAPKIGVKRAKNGSDWLSRHIPPPIPAPAPRLPLPKNPPGAAAARNPSANQSAGRTRRSQWERGAFIASPVAG